MGIPSSLSKFHCLIGPVSRVERDLRQRDEATARKKRKLSSPKLQLVEWLKDYLDDQLGQVAREEEISPPVTRQPDVFSEPIHVDNAESQTTAAKIEKEAKQQQKILSSPRVGPECSDLIVNGQSVEMGELKESLETSLAEIERLKTENIFRTGSRAPSPSDHT
jgi:biotin carboxyl carrier protein